jgi:hypothetical protein
MAMPEASEFKICHELGRCDDLDESSDEEAEVIMESKCSLKDCEDMEQFISRLEETSETNTKKMAVILLSVLKELRNPPDKVNAISMDSDIVSLPKDRFISVTKFIQHASSVLLTKIPPAERSYIHGAFSNPHYEIYHSWTSRLSSVPFMKDPTTMKNIEELYNINKSKKIVGRMILVVNVLGEILDSIKYSNLGDRISASSILGKSFPNGDKFSQDFHAVIDQVMHFVNHGDVKREVRKADEIPFTNIFQFVTPIAPVPEQEPPVLPPPIPEPLSTESPGSEKPAAAVAKRKRGPSDPNKKTKRTQKRGAEFIEKQARLEEDIRKKKLQDDKNFNMVFGE